MKRILHTTILLGGGLALWTAIDRVHTTARDRWSAYRLKIAEEVVTDYFLTRPIEIDLGKEPRLIDPGNMSRNDLSKALYTALGRLETCEYTIESARGMLNTHE